MADPVTLTAISLGATALGTGVSAIGANKTASAQAGMFTYQAGVAQVNQQIQKQNADYTRKAGEVEAQQIGMKTAAQIGQTKAIQSASGLDVNSGSNVQVRASEAAIGGEDVAISRANTARKAYGFDVAADQAGIQSSIDLASASNARSAGKLGVLSSILGGASSVSSKWLQASTAGVGSSAGDGYYGGSPETNFRLAPA